MTSVPFRAATVGARKLLLPFATDRPGFEAFVPGRNREAFEYLLLLAGGAPGVSLYLHGPSGSGKTHLLSAACARVTERGGRAAYMALGTLPVGDLTCPAWMEGLELFEHPSALPRARWGLSHPRGLPVFHTVRAPTAEELQSLLARIIKRLMNRMHREVQL